MNSKIEYAHVSNTLQAKNSLTSYMLDDSAKINDYRDAASSTYSHVGVDLHQWTIDGV